MDAQQPLVKIEVDPTLQQQEPRRGRLLLTALSLVFVVALMTVGALASNEHPVVSPESEPSTRRHLRSGHFISPHTIVLEAQAPDSKTAITIPPAFAKTNKDSDQNSSQLKSGHCNSVTGKCNN